MTTKCKAGNYIGFHPVLVCFRLIPEVKVYLFITNQLGLFDKKQIQSITVMPFTSIVDGEIIQDHWSFNMTNALMSRLGKVSSIKSVYTNVNQPVIAQAGLVEVGGDLGVDAVLTGSISREGAMVTVNTMLINVRNEEIVWSEMYTREVRNIMKLQSELVQAIIDAIEVAVTPDELKAIGTDTEVDANGYEYLLKGQYHLYRLDPENYDSALYYFNLASSYKGLESKAYGGIALVWAHKGQWGREAPLVAAGKLIRAYHKAFEYDALEEDALLARAHAYTSYLWDWDSAVYSFEQALRYNPNHVELHLFYADLLVSLHLNERAFGHIDKAIALAPKNPFVHCIKGWVLFANGMNNEAELSLLESLKAGYRIALSHRCLWGIYHNRKDYSSAAFQAGEFYASQGIQKVSEVFKGVRTHSDYLKALEEAAIELELYKQSAYVSSMRVARLYAFSGKSEKALDWLEKAYEERYTSFFSLNTDPHWESLRQQEKFINLVDTMNLTLPRR